MMSSVRLRLTLAVAAIVGLLAVTAALLAPHTVEQSLIGDRLDAQVEREVTIVATPVVVTSNGGVLTDGELTSFFAPRIASLLATLDRAGVFEELRALTDDGEFAVIPLSGVLANVGADDRITLEHAPPSAATMPVVSFARLIELAEPYDDSDELWQRFERDMADLFPGLTPVPSFVDPLTEVEPTRWVMGTREIAGVEVIVAASGDGIERTVDRMRTLLWILAPISMILAAAVTWLLAGRTLRPVRAITEQTRRIRANTLFERVPVPPSRDEIGVLATEMNTMLDRVEQADDQRRQFVADASHELRSPIAVLKAQAELTIATSADAETVDLATGVLDETDRLSAIVDDLLALARHDATLPPPGQPVDLDDVVLTEANRPRRVPVDTSSVSAGRVRGRVDELGRVVAHLLDNASRHAVTQVRVALVAEGDEIVLTVDDDGPGIAEDDRDRVFERFVRLDEARHRDAGGAGLGLAVVATVARASGGSVTVGDADLGGARFELRLPAAD